MSGADLVLDLDGTIIDARVRQTTLLSQCLTDLDATMIDEYDFWEAKRNGLNTRAALESLGVSNELAAAARDRWAAQIESDRWLALDELLPGALEAMCDVASRRYLITVLTARQSEKSVHHQVRRLGIEPVIRDLIVVPPHAAVAEKAARLTQINPLLFVGDTEVDAEAAARSATPFIAVSSGQRSAGFLSNIGGEVVPDLVSALRRLPALDRPA